MSDLSDSVKTKRCSKCRAVKSVEEFYTCARDVRHNLCKPCSAEHSRAWAISNRESRMVISARHRAKKEGVAFSLNRLDIEIPGECPVCSVAMSYLDGRNVVPSLDRIIPARGYTKENVIVLCNACNRKKQNSTAEELAAMAEWIYRIREERGLC